MALSDIVPNRSRSATRARRKSIPTDETVDGLDIAAIPGVAPMTIARAQIDPMLATLADRPFRDDDWMFEPKLDGMRVLCAVGLGGVRMYSHRGQDSSF